MMCAILTCRPWDEKAPLHAQSRAHALCLPAGFSCEVAVDSCGRQSLALFHSKLPRWLATGLPRVARGWVAAFATLLHGLLIPLPSPPGYTSPAQCQCVLSGPHGAQTLTTRRRRRTRRDRHPVDQASALTEPPLSALMRCHSKTVAHADRHVKRSLRQNTASHFHSTGPENRCYPSSSRRADLDCA